MSNLYISTYPASSRIDLCNALAGQHQYGIWHYVHADGEETILRDATFTNHWLPVGHLMGKTYAKGLRRLLLQERPKVIMVQEFSLITIQLLLLRRRFGYKLVSICDDSMDMIRGNDFSWTHRLARRVIPRFLDDVILHSVAVRDWYRAHFGKGLMMPIIADERRIIPALEEALPLAKELSVDERPVVAFVGRLVGLKNIPTLLRAFAPWKDRGQLVIIGDGPERKALEAMAPYALFTGMLSGKDLFAWYNRMDVLVLPSTQEAYGAVTGEALMAGAQVIVSDRAGSLDLVREGINGFLVNPLDEDALSQRIGQCLNTVPSVRPDAVRPNLLPYRFSQCLQLLLEGINGL